MMKQDFQRAVLNRIPRMEEDSARHFREVLFLCDEYHTFATVGESDPSGDEKFFALSRQGANERTAMAGPSSSRGLPRDRG